MPDKLIYPNGSGITVVTDGADLHNNDMIFPSMSTGGAAQQANYSTIREAIKKYPPEFGSVQGTPGILFANPNFNANGQGFWMATSYSQNTLSGTFVNFQIGLAGYKILGVHLYVDVAVVDDAGDDTWDAAYYGGITQAISTGNSPTVGTNVIKMFDPNANSPIASASFGVTVTPNGGNFTAGQITCVGYYQRIFNA